MLAASGQNLLGEDGSKLWLRYNTITDSKLLGEYKTVIKGYSVEGISPVFNSAREELALGLSGLLGEKMDNEKIAAKEGFVLAGTPSSSKIIAMLTKNSGLREMGDEGYLIFSAKYKRKNITVIAANTDRGVLYGTFHLLRLMQTGRSIRTLDIKSKPAINVRILNHWDNLNRSVERGYAGLSLWDWKTLPDSIPERFRYYARANASIGINSTVLTNVNANALILTRDYLVKVAAIADVFRPYGIRVYLTARFSAPVEIGKLATADPLDENVRKWWKDKAEEIYSLIPDFGGFTVKANSEGQPGPQNYKRTHADGANMLADALGPHGGIVMWRAFVYDNNVPVDRAMQAYNEFMPLDGSFRDNVLIQVKNGPVDFQPREPFHPLFGAMTKTSVMPEFQITQEYLGSSVHLVYLAPLFEECLKSDTWARGKGSLVADAITGRLHPQKITAMAGVTNIGNVKNWTGHPFAQANWYAFGRLAWDPYAGSEDIADDWLKMTFTSDEGFIGDIKKMMLNSREVTVNYMTPLGLHHIMYAGHHYGPGPWVNRGRADQTSVYFHKADSIGIGFNRTSGGSNAVGQYFAGAREVFDNVNTCPDNLLLWFHHLPWDYRLKSGNSLWNEICLRYDSGVSDVKRMINTWQAQEGKIDPERFNQVLELLRKQVRDAAIWRDACVLYFQTFSKRQFPDGFVKPEHDLNYYLNYRYTDIPGITRGM
ncbi:MAG: alpha-glucuronidase family glycosyl hydrolase [Bacteroidales bacterium]